MKKRQDSITNEMLRFSNVILLSKLEELFKNVFDSSCYPDAWNNETQKSSLHKAFYITVTDLRFAIIGLHDPSFSADKKLVQIIKL